jgi:hypothetical protein
MLNIGLCILHNEGAESLMQVYGVQFCTRNSLDAYFDLGKRRVMATALTSIERERETRVTSPSAPKLLIVEQSRGIHDLLKRGFSSTISLDITADIDVIPSWVRRTTYDMLICVVEGADFPK